MGELKECCKDLGNRAEGAGPRGMGGAELREDVSVTHCTVCTCRHFEAQVDPVNLGFTASTL